MSTAKEFLTTAIRRLKYYKELGDKTFEQLNEWDTQRVGLSLSTQ